MDFVTVLFVVGGYVLGAWSWPQVSVYVKEKLSYFKD